MPCSATWFQTSLTLALTGPDGQAAIVFSLLFSHSLFSYIISGHPASVWAEGQCRVPGWLGHRHLRRHGGQPVVQGVKDQRQQQVGNLGSIVMGRMQTKTLLQLEHSSHMLPTECT